MKSENHVAFLLAVAMLPAGCRVPEGEATGDEARSGAVEIRSGVLQDDKVAARGDPVDFKRFQVGQVTPCTINIYWDNPALAARLVLRDMFGGTVAEVAHVKGSAKDTVGPVTLTMGVCSPSFGWKVSTMRSEKARSAAESGPSRRAKTTTTSL